MKAKYLFLLGVVVIIAMATAVSGLEPGGADVTDILNLGEMVVQDEENVTVEAGNITQANLDTNMSTMKWAALVGNASGYIVLGDAENNQIYNWAATGLLVYASEDSNPTWSSLADANEAAVVGQYGFLITGTSDAYDQTFTGGAEDISSEIFSLTSDYATTLSTGVTVWKTYSLTDGGDIVFAALVVDDGDSYHGDTADFQLLLPEDGTGQDTDVTTYWLWLELI